MRSPLSRRFKGLMPVVIDVETAGLQAEINALLELAAVFLTIDANGHMQRTETLAYNIEPFQGSIIEQEALLVTGIDPENPLRYAIPETQALQRLFTAVNQQLTETGCYRAVLVGHNAWFDLSFLLAAAKRSELKHNPFHHFTTFDTASLAAMAFGETVLARAMRRAKLPFDTTKAHSAIYDAEKTADLFCMIANRWR